MNETPFIFKIVTKHEPLVDDPFYAWLDANVKKGEKNTDGALITQYLKSLGFVVGQDRITEEQLEILRHVAEAWYRGPWGKPTKFDDLFCNTGTEYYIMGRKEKLGITHELSDLVVSSGWIYNVSPETTYFEIIGGNRLYAKYQQILGSRFICFISDLEAE